MPVIFKKISPSKLKQKVFLEELKAGAETVRKGVTKDYEATVASWNTKPSFRSEVVTSPGGGIAVHVDTSDERYLFVSEGTKPHVIKPRRAKRLRFQGNYKAKTQPGVIKSSGGGASGPFVYRRIVRHPGIKARNFAKTIRQKWEPFFGRELQRSLDRAAKKSGHGM